MNSRVRLLSVAAVVAVLSCQAGTDVVSIPGGADSLSVGASAISVDTSVVSGDTVLLTVTDTLLQAPDTILTTVVDTVVEMVVDSVVRTVVDTVVNGADTVFSTVTDTIFEMTVDSVFINTIDTVVAVDTVVVQSVDTVVARDTVVVVDTVLSGGGSSVSVSEGTLELNVGESAALNGVAINPLGQPSTALDVLWSSEDARIASVSAEGIVLGVSQGSTRIFAVSDGAAATIPTTVIDTIAPLEILTVQLPDATLGQAYQAQLEAVGGSGVYAWDVVNGTLPQGLRLEPGGRVSGIATEAGASQVTVRVSSFGRELNSAVGILVIDPALPDPILNLNFEKYATTSELIEDCATFLCYEDSRDAENRGKTLDTSVGYGLLTRSMRYDYLHGGDGCNSITNTRSLGFPRAEEVWIEVAVRWSANFTTTNYACSPNDHKLIFGGTTQGNTYRWQLKVGSDSGPSHSVSVRAAGTNAGENDERRVQGIRASDLWDGEWHIVRLHWKHSSPANTGANGAQELWIDGELLYSETGITNRTDTGAQDYISSIALGRNKDDGPAGVLMSIWWGYAKVWNQDPGDWN